MKREFDFISKLDARDVDYVLNKKKEHAALLIQRNYRRLKQQRAYREQRQRGLTHEDLEPEKTEEDLARIAVDKKFLEDRRAYEQDQRPDTYYAAISNDRRDELREKVAAARRMFSQAQIEGLAPEDIYDRYANASQQFQSDYALHEATRAAAHGQLVETAAMMHFLVDFEPEEFKDAAKPLPVAETMAQEADNEEVAALEAAARLRRIRAWGDAVAATYKEDDDPRAHEGDQAGRTEAIRAHKERLARDRKRTDWQAWVEEDELDMEGERLISEIKNYKSEHFFNTRFYT